MKVLPSSTVDATVMLPPQVSTRPRTRARPMPLPSNEREVLCTRWKRSKMASKSLSRMPMPVSEMEMQALEASKQTATLIVPDSVYLRALLSKWKASVSQLKPITRAD